MKKEVIVIALCIIISIFIYSLTTRYSLISDSGHTYKIDRLTGKVWYLQENSDKAITNFDIEVKEKPVK